MECSTLLFFYASLAWFHHLRSRTSLNMAKPKEKKCNAIIRVSPEFVIIAIIVFYNTLNVLIDSTAVLEIPPINTRTRLKVNLIPRHFPREYIYEYWKRHRLQLLTCCHISKFVFRRVKQLSKLIFFFKMTSDLW